MTAASRVGWLDDAINPIVVKELRQAVKSRVVVVVLLLFLALQLVVMGFTLFGSIEAQRGPEAINLQLGRRVFSGLQVLLVGTCMLLVPTYVGVRFGSERADMNADLMFITTLRPRAIIAGKTFAGIMIVALVFSACAPFLVFTYLLRGIDIPTIVLILLIDVFVVLIAMQSALFLASLPGGRILKAMFGLVGAGFILWAMGMTIGVTSTMLVFGGSMELERPEVLAALASMCGLGVGIILQMFVWSVALISPNSSNFMVGPRIFMVLVWLISGGIVWAWAVHESELLLMYIWLVFMAFIFGLQVLISLSERSTYSTRVRKQIPQLGLLRMVVWPWYTGAGAGLVMCVLLTIISFIVVWNADYYIPSKRAYFDIRNQAQMLQSIAVGLLYVWGFGLSAIVMQQWITNEQIKNAPTWIIAGLLFGLATAIPVALHFISTGGRPGGADSYWWAITNPFMAVPTFAEAPGWSMASEYKTVCAWFLGIWNGTVTLLALPWFIQQIRAFQPWNPTEVTQ